MAKKLSVRLNDKAEERLNKLKEFYNSKPDFKDLDGNISYNDIIQIALRALSEDVGLE